MDAPKEESGIDALTFIEKHGVEVWVRANDLDGLSITREQLELLLVRLQLSLARVAALLNCHEELLARKATRWNIRPIEPTESEERSGRRGRLFRALSWVVENDPTVKTERDINIYYVYLHRHPVTNETLYVGKGVDSRAWNMLSRHPDHTAMLYKFLQEGHPPGSWVSLVKWGLTEYEALMLEDKLQRQLVKQNVALLNRLRPPVVGRAQSGWKAEKKAPFDQLRIAAIHAAAVKDLRSCDLETKEGFHKAIEISLALVPADTFYVSMWELLSRLGIPRRSKRMIDTRERIIAAFAAGVDGWFLDESMYIRRDLE
jgi:hypothetical protein